MVKRIVSKLVPFFLALSLASGTGMVATQAGDAGATRTIETTPDVDYFGFDLRSLQNISLADCSNACVADTDCKAFTYNPKVRWCFLKSDFAKAKPFAGAIAGKIVETATQAMSTPVAETDLGAAPKLLAIPQQVFSDARLMKNSLKLADDQDGMDVDALLKTGKDFAVANDFPNAILSFEGALSLDPEDQTLWLDVARSLLGSADNTDAINKANLAAANAYLLTRTKTERALSLHVLAQTFARQSAFRTALTIYKESLKLDQSAKVKAEYETLKQEQGFRVTDHTIDIESETPRACVQFSEPLVKAGVDYTPFVTVDGTAPKAMEAKDNQICVEGLEHGKRYAVTLRSGLPSSVDEPLEKNIDLDIYVRDRTASLHFTGDNFVLPGTARRGIPLVSVNTDTANLTLYRVGDRGLTHLMAGSRFLSQLDGYSSTELADVAGEALWRGSIDIKPELNREVITSFPVDEALPERKAGVYVLTATAPNSGQQEWDTKATQWFVVSDIGLATFAGTDGLTVFARSLASAKPMAGVELTLLAKNNDVLGTAVTDASGQARFVAGLIRGTASMTPAIITAKNGADDFMFLDMTRAGFDLSDRGVTGRTAPGAIDILPWTERGIYRAGETVHASAMARDSNGNAIENLPMTVIFSRPDGVEDRRFVNVSSVLGYYAIDLPLGSTAMRGSWTMQLYTDPKAAPLAETKFRVDDFVPDRTEFDLSAEEPIVEIGKPAQVSIQGRYLYGAPAAGLFLEADVILKPTRETSLFPGYVFGLADEETNEGNRTPVEDLPVLDEKGEAAFNIAIDAVPSTTQRLSADIVVRMLEAGGRAVEKTLTLPVRPMGDMIGIRPDFSGSLAENSIASFTIITVDADGRKKALPDLAWSLVELVETYQWYQDGKAWRYEPVKSTKQIATGKVSTTADGATLKMPVGWGRYRLEIAAGGAEGALSSVEFDAGNYVAASTTETPDGLDIALDKDRYTVGETAKLKISPRFAGDVLITAGSEQLILSITDPVPEGGTEIDLPVTEAFGGGTYITATLYRPGDAQESHMPMRAIGVKWLTVDPAERKLAVQINSPDRIAPRQPMTLSVDVKGAGVGEDAYVSVAAVDVGILNLTSYEAPNPDGWYFGQRQLGLEIRDMYGRLIDGSLGAFGKLRTGGDGAEMPLQGKPPTEKLVAFFSGPVKLDAQGQASVQFDIPQFNGTARLMAVAWSKTGVGHAQKDVVIRDPVVVTASLPKFLAPGDSARLRLDIDNIDAPAGDYTLTVTGNAFVQADLPPEKQTITLDSGAKQALELPLLGLGDGDGQISIQLSSNDGMRFEQAIDVPVRSGALPMTTRHPVTIQPEGSLTVDSALLSESRMQGAKVALNVSRSSTFDVPALLMSLDQYPYGCAEQTASKALPLLYLGELAIQNGLPDDGERKKRVQDAIYRVLSYQSSTGSFGLWAPGSGDLWLDSYLSDFLTRAREQAYDVPEDAMVLALNNLQNAVGFDLDLSTQGQQVAYALYVLARNKKAAISDLRYYADTRLSEFRTPLARAQLAAALSLYGDRQRSDAVFDDAYRMTLLKNVGLERDDYGSNLRDSAAMLTLAAESRPQPPVMTDLIKSVSDQWEASTATSTQEQSWMLLAARSLANGDTDLKLDINGAVLSGGFRAKMTGEQLAASPVVIRNLGTEPLKAVITTVAAPQEPLAAGGEGFSIERRYYTLDGEEANVSQAQQNDRYVVVLHVSQANAWPSRIMVSDMLPAGFEIDNPGLVSSARLQQFDWLDDVEVAHTEFRSDRFLAAFDRTPDSASDFTFAYVVRAVTPGNYDHPAAVVEDMYRPQFSARTASGRMEVLEAQ